MWDENKYPLGEIPLFQNAISKTEEVVFVAFVRGTIHKAFCDHDITRDQWQWMRTKIIDACQKEFLYVLKSRQAHVGYIGEDCPGEVRLLETDPPEITLTFGPIPDDILDPKRWGVSL